MMLEILDVLANPQRYRAKIDRGGITIAPIKLQDDPMLELIATLTTIAANEEFTEHQRREQMVIAINDAAPARLPSFMADMPLSYDRQPDGTVIVGPRQ